VTLVVAAVVSVGLTELYFSYQDSKRALTRFELDKASAAATSIEQLVQNLLLELDAVAQPTAASGPAGLRQRNQDFHRLLDRDSLANRYFLSVSEQMYESHGIIVNSFRALEPRATDAICSTTFWSSRTFPGQL